MLRYYANVIAYTCTCSALQIFPDEGYAGTFLLFHPHFNKIEYELRDKSFRENCCTVGFDKLCQQFLKRRVTSSCIGYEPPPDLELRIKKKLCINTASTDSLLFLGTNPTKIAEKLIPCPCSQLHAKEDDRFILQSESMDFCFVSRNPITMNLPVLQLTVTQQCCYHGNGY